MQVGYNSAVLCDHVALTGNKRPWIIWPQVGVHVRGLVVCPIVCGENRQKNNHPAVSLESTTVYDNLPPSLSPSPSFFSLCGTIHSNSTKWILSLNSQKSFPVYLRAIFLCSLTLCSCYSSASIITPFSLFAPPLPHPLFNPCILSPLFSYVPSRHYERALL